MQPHQYGAMPDGAARASGAHDAPALQRVRHARHERAPADDEDRLEVLADLLVAARRTRAVEDRNVERELARLEAHVDRVAAGVRRRRRRGLRRCRGGGLARRRGDHRLRVRVVDIDDLHRRVCGPVAVRARGRLAGALRCLRVRSILLARGGRSVLAGRSCSSRKNCSEVSAQRPLRAGADYAPEAAAFGGSSAASAWASLMLGVIRPVAATTGGTSCGAVGVGSADGNKCCVDIIIAWVYGKQSTPCLSVLARASSAQPRPT